MEAARGKMGAASAAVNDTIAALEGLKRQAELDEAAAAAAAKEAATARGKARKLRLEIAEREATMQLQRAEATTNAVRAARAELRRLSQEQRTAEQQAGAAAAAQAAAAAVAKQDGAALKKQQASGWAPTVGQSVFVPRLGTRAKVLSVSGEQLSLQAGRLKLTATLDEVRERQ